jgi:predicted glycosyltransferase
MRVWIDLAAPPQVLFFRPIIAALQRDGHELLVTVRNFNNAPGIATRLAINHTVVGRHGGRRTSAKGVAILARAGELAMLAHRFRPHLATSHNSYAQAIAAALLRVPLVTAMDFEHQPANHISFRLAQTVVVPEFFPSGALRRFGAHFGRVVRYPGTKEEIYLADFQPDQNFPLDFGLPPSRIVVTMRPPARSALYHGFENTLFDAAVERIATEPSAFIVLLGRDGTNNSWSHFANVFVPKVPVDGPNLVFWSDLVVSGGGTMNREAAVVGTPAYTVYAGKPIAVDDYLIQLGRMKRISSAADLEQLALQKKIRGAVLARADGLHRILDVLVATLGGSESLTVRA